MARDARLAPKDVQMPELDGFDMLDELAPSERPVAIFATAYVERPNRRRIGCRIPVR